MAELDPKKQPTGASDDPFYQIEMQYGVSGRPIFTHGPIVRRFIAAWVILALMVIGDSYFNWRNSHLITNERAARSQLINDYLTKQCERDRTKDDVFISILSRGGERFAREIAAIRSVDRKCMEQIPPVLPSH